MSTILFNRDVEVYISTVDTGFTVDNTAKISILGGYNINTKSNNSSSDINRISDTPARIGFNVTDEINPVTFNFSTYAKPFIDGSSNINCVEKLLYDSLGGIASTPAPANYTVNFGKVNTLIPIFIFIAYNDKYYKLSQAVVEQVKISFNIDKLTMIDWNIQAQTYTIVNSLPDTYSDNTSELPQIKNKLSIVQIDPEFITPSLGWIDFPVTGGSLTIKNKVQFPQRKTLDVSVSTPFTHIVGTREVLGTITCYMHTGIRKTGQLFEEIYNNYLDINGNTKILFYIGGKTAPYIYVLIDKAIINLPKQITQDIISYDLSFVTRESSLGANDDLIFRYYA